MNKRKLTVLVSMVLAIAAICAVCTYAYLSDTTTVVTNTFCVGDIDIDLEESVVDLYGEVTDPAATTDEGNKYKLIPGHEYTKDPTITVTAGSEPCYLFVKVVDGLAAIEDDDTIAAQMTSNGWTKITDTDIWYYKDKVDAREEAKTVDVFGSFKLKSDAKIEDYEKATITVMAIAVQSDGFDSAMDAYTAMDD